MRFLDPAAGRWGRQTAVGAELIALKQTENGRDAVCPPRDKTWLDDFFNVQPRMTRLLELD
jgi:hypothetical protein